MPNSFLRLAVVLLWTLAAGSLHAAAPAWPFAPPTRPAAPTVKDATWVHNPVDAFVLARLEQNGLHPNPQAEKIALVRRVTFDLTGLAPTPAERDAFLADASPDAYEKVVDRLLASPRFGERWAQHWLDVVRFAETEGFKLDRLRPDAFRYRDYVIRSFNNDLPYDRFIRQQLAGDELEPDQPDALIATGWLRLHPEESNGSDYTLIRQDVLNDVTDVCAATFLGLTVGCARCHDHKFDPISQKDYYSLQAFFAGLMQRDESIALPPADRARYNRDLQIWEKATAETRAAIDALTAPIRRQIFDEWVVVFDPATQEALKKPAADRTPLQRQLAQLAIKQIERKYGRITRRMTTVQKAHYDALQNTLASFDKLKPPTPPTAMAAGDVGPTVPATHRLSGGNPLKPRDEVAPAFLECLGAAEPQIKPLPSSSGRRSALAQWLTRPDHPLTARVFVNRLWQHYFGQGLVATPNDFGAMGEAPTHPELLDFLATELVRNGWRAKAVHRLIVTSAAYRQSSQPTLNPTLTAALKTDPDDKLLWHARMRRRDAESLRDTALQVSGNLSLRMFGASSRPELPGELADNRYAWAADTRPEDRNRRSVYLISKRNLRLPLFAAFDAPDRLSSCPARAETVNAPRALALLNGPFFGDQARSLAASLTTAHGAEVHGLVRHAFLTVFNREPSADEMAASVDFLARQTRLIASPNSPAAVADFCHALLNSAEFLYVE